MCSRRKRISFEDHLLLNSWQKYRRYRIIPFKLFVDVLQLLMAVVVVVVLVRQSSSYNNSSIDTFRHLFAPDECRDVYEQTQLISCLADAVQAYFSWDERSPSKIVLRPPAQLHTVRYVGDFFNETTGWFNDNDYRVAHSDVDLFNASYLGPFQGAAAGEFIKTLREVGLLFEAATFSPSTGSPWTWRISVRWAVDGFGSGKFERTLKADKYYHFKDFNNPLFFLHLFGLLVNVLTAFLAARSFWRSILRYRAVRERFLYSVTSRSWQSIPFRVRRKIFKTWNLLSLVTCAILIASNIMGILNHVMEPPATGVELDSTLDTSASLMAGLGVFLSFISTMRYMEMIKRLHLMMSTLQLAASKIFFLLVSIVPIFLGYAMMGIGLFSSYSNRWEDFQTSCVSLFGIMNGDDIIGVMNDLLEKYPYQWVSQLYIYSFCVLFITVVLNVFINVIADSFELAKYWDAASWRDRVKSFQLKDLMDLIEQEQKGEVELLQDHVVDDLTQFDAAEVQAIVKRHNEAMQREIDRYMSNFQGE